MNDATNVSVGKPNKIGAVFNAPLGTDLPADATTPLDNAFTGLGYLSDAGWTLSPNVKEGSEITAYGGDVVLKTDATTAWTTKFVLIETKEESLKAYFGEENVTVSGDNIQIAVDNTPRETSIWVFNLVLTGGKPARVVIPNGKVTAFDDLTYNDTAPIGYGMTISALPDSTGKQYYEFIDPPVVG